MSALIWLSIVSFLWTASCRNIDVSGTDKSEGYFGYEMVEFRLEDLTLRLSDLMNKMSENRNATNERIDKLAATVAASNNRLSYMSTTNRMETQERFEEIASKLTEELEPLRDTLKNNHNVVGSNFSRLLDRITGLQGTGDFVLSKQRLVENKINDITARMSTLDSQSKQILKNHFDLVIPSCSVAKVPGVYRLQTPSVNVLCESTIFGGGWLVIQLRPNGDTSFYKNWYDYRTGFGTVGPYTEFWLGLEAIHQITTSGDYELYISIKNEQYELKYAKYSQFKVSSENDGYRLTIGDYSGTASNALGVHNNMKFSTYDIDNDANSTRNCAKDFQSGWWFKDCRTSNLNGPYKKASNGYGIEWGQWADAATYSRMMIRRK